MKDPTWRPTKGKPWRAARPATRRRLARSALSSAYGAPAVRSLWWDHQRAKAGEA